MAARLSMCTTLLAALGLAAATQGLAATSQSKTLPASYNIPLWPEGKVPLAKGDGPLDKPFLSVFPASPQAVKAGETHGAIVIAPGGSNIMLMYGGEGMEVAERFNDWGVTAFVLTYRLSPRYGEDARVLDATRAMQIVRSRAAEFHIDPKRVGFIGFSAGSALARSMAAAAKPGDASASDPIDRASSRPDYLGMIYSAGRATPGESLKDFPPTFLCAAEFDKGAAIGSAQFFTELTKAGAIAEIHIYQQGRHGFGTGFGSFNFNDWMGRLQHFLQVDNLLPGGRP